MKRISISIILMSLLAACASSKPKETNVAAPAAAPAAEAPAATAEQAPAAPTPVVEVDPLNDPNSILAKRSVYFPFDVAAVQPADRPIVEAHAKYLKEHPARKVRVEGNCDERGSKEYNLALGQRRADSVKRMLIEGGAKEGQIETISYGEEKPRCTEHNEACWMQNRRGDIKYQ
jgi:peptidoglycan-associated lipoprotein